MLLLLSTLFCLLTLTLVIIPYRRQRIARLRRAFLESYRDFQCLAVRRHGKELGDLSYDELREHYQLTETYNRIGHGEARLLKLRALMRSLR